MGSRLADESILARLEHSWLEPPYMKSNLPLCTCCGGEIDESYLLDGKHYCSDCAKEMYREWVDDDPVECDICGKLLDESYYNSAGEILCESCFKDSYRE
jgi:formylmethanofuran dehydrogenase subunit E